MFENQLVYYLVTVFYRIMWVNCPIIRVFVVFGERVNTSGYPYAVFYSVMYVNSPIISMLVAFRNE